MKKNTALVFLVGLLLSGLFLMFSSDAAIAGENHAGTIQKDPLVEVFYFHYSRRCASCINVEKETKRLVEETYATEIQAGELVFASINLEEPANQAIAERAGASGQSILVVGAGQRQELTQQGFMYARNASRYQQELKKTIDPILAAAKK